MSENGFSYNDVLNTVRSVFEDYTQSSKGGLEENTKVSSLVTDSMHLVEIMLGIEELLPVEYNTTSENVLFNDLLSDEDGKANTLGTLARVTFIMIHNLDDLDATLNPALSIGGDLGDVDGEFPKLPVKPIQETQPLLTPKR